MFCNKLDFFVSGKLFQPSLMFVGNVRSLPKRIAPEKCFLSGTFRLYPQPLDYVGKARKGQTL